MSVAQAAKQVMARVGVLSVSMKCHNSGKGHHLEIQLDGPIFEAGHSLLVLVRSFPLNLPLPAAT